MIITIAHTLVTLLLLNIYCLLLIPFTSKIPKFEPGSTACSVLCSKTKYKNITIISTAEIQIYTWIITGGGGRLNSSPPPTPIRSGFCQKNLPYVFAAKIMPQKYVVNSVQISLKIHFLFFHLSYRHEKEYNHFFCSLL